MSASDAPRELGQVELIETGVRSGQHVRARPPRQSESSHLSISSFRKRRATHARDADQARKAAQWHTRRARSELKRSGCAFGEAADLQQLRSFFLRHGAHGSLDKVSPVSRCRARTQNIATEGEFAFSGGVYSVLPRHSSASNSGTARSKLGRADANARPLIKS